MFYPAALLLRRVAAGGPGFAARYDAALAALLAR